MTSARRYTREIEARWTALLERPAMLGERDWSVICDWHARGIPLALIHEAFEQYAEKLRRRRSRPRNLGVIVPLVEESWRTVCGGRAEIREEQTHSGNRQAEPGVLWRQSAEHLPADDPLRAWILDLLRRLAEGDSAESCEKRLQEGLLEYLTPALLDELERDVDSDLAVFRDRMATETWQGTRRRALISAARRRFGLARLGPTPALSNP